MGFAIPLSELNSPDRSVGNKTRRKRVLSRKDRDQCGIIGERERLGRAREIRLRKDTFKRESLE